VVSTDRLAVSVVLTFAWAIITWFFEDLVLLVSHKSGRVRSHISDRSLQLLPWCVFTAGILFRQLLLCAEHAVYCSFAAM
jgi:hypothetical protein